MSKVSQVHSSIPPGRVAPFQMKQITDAAVSQLTKLGITIDPSVVHQQVRELYAGDSAFTPTATAPSIATPIQFLQTWLPGFVSIITSARKIDDILGIKTVGSWEDQEIVQGIVEPEITAAEYGDYTNVPLASWNTNFERRTIVRGEAGITVGTLEEGRSAAMRLSSAQTKRQAAAVGLEVFRNAVGFYGWNGGNNRTFGFLNDPNLLAGISAPSGGWATATAQQIIGDIRLAIITLRTQSQDQVDPEKTAMTLVLPTDKVDYLSVITDFGISVRDWIKQTYPKIRIVSAPELQVAYTNPSSVQVDVFYLFADDIDASVDGSTDGGETFIQMVQTKFMTLGVEKRAKSYVEDYSNASAGVMCKRPWAVVRVYGI